MLVGRSDKTKLLTVVEVRVYMALLCEHILAYVCVSWLVEFMRFLLLSCR